MDPGCWVWEVEWGEWWSITSWMYGSTASLQEGCTLTRSLLMLIYQSVHLYKWWCFFHQVHSVQSTPSAHPFWMCAAPDMAHSNCFKFGARTDTCHHVWRLSKVGEGKDRWCSTKTSQDYCARVWWAEHICSVDFLRYPSGCLVSISILVLSTI